MHGNVDHQRKAFLLACHFLFLEMANNKAMNAIEREAMLDFNSIEIIHKYPTGLE